MNGLLNGKVENINVVNEIEAYFIIFDTIGTIWNCFILHCMDIEIISDSAHRLLVCNTFLTYLRIQLNHHIFAKCQHHNSMRKHTCSTSLQLFGI